MPGDELTIWMWSEACRHLAQAETLHRRFYGLSGDSSEFSWEPPADVFETEREVLIEVALPGVAADAVEVSVEAGLLVVRGERALPEIPGPAVIRRMELPHGRFRRQIRLAPGRYEFARRQLVDGCLRLVLRKIA
jgi:HSP20 family molecular chaperone IbpA